MNTQDLIALARRFCGGMDVRWSFSDAGLEAFCAALAAAQPKADEVRYECEKCAWPKSWVSCAECLATQKKADERGSVEPEHGQLDPRTALEQARTMLRYCDAFNGQKFSPLDDVDRLNLATALDNLQETAAMLLNMADRVATAPARDGSEPGLRKFEEWLNKYRNHDVSTVFHDIVAKYAAALAAAPLSAPKADEEKP